jgi:hypothetical protein
MAITQNITTKFTPNAKEVNYLSKSFPEFRQNLIDFAKTYYPNTYTDFNEASPGMMFIEMAAYVGDVLSFYIDKSFQENLLSVASEQKNVVAIAQSLGYKPRLSSPAMVTAKVYQMVPALSSAQNYNPDSRFFLTLKTNSRFSSNIPPLQTFRLTEDVNFSDPEGRIIQVFSRDISGNPTKYVVSKPAKLVAGQTKTISVDFGSPQKFSRIEISDENAIAIVSVIDSDGNEWKQVDFLGQDVIIEERMVAPITSNGYLQSDVLPNSPPPAKLISYKKVPRRFAIRLNTDMKLELWFGSGTQNVDETLIQLNSTQIANTKYDQVISSNALDPADFLDSDSFGLAPSNTTLTVTYLVGGGVESNVPSNSITNVDSLEIVNNIQNYELSLRPQFNEVVDSVTINNEEPATGGGSSETIEEIRQNALAYFNAQARVVTDKDYTVRSLSMPPQFGTVAKVFVLRDEQMTVQQLQNAGLLSENIDTNPFTNATYVENPIAPNSINLYVLGYNAQGQLTILNSLVKRNLAKYLEQYRMLTDDVNILDAFIVNIAVNFDIVVKPRYNMNDVLARSIDSVKQFFNIDNWQINQPIVLNDLRLSIGAIDGVQSVTNITVTNKYKFRDGKDYQEYRYPIETATIDDIIYPSLDPCIFEIRYPETDIIGNARQ